MTRLGLDVGQARIRAVITRGSRITWLGSTPVAPGEVIGDAIERLLPEAQRFFGGRRSARVCAALGPSFVQTKPLAGIPKLPHQRLVAQLVRENATSFFLRARGPIALGRIDSRDDGSTWAAGFDGEALQQVRDSLRRAGMRFEQAVPVVSAIVSFAPNGSFVWSDGGSRVHVTAKGGAIHRIRRLSSFAHSEFEHPTLPDALATLGENGWPYVAAYAAARSSRGAAFAWRPEIDPRRSRLIKRARNTVAASMMIGVAMAALLAPGLRATRFVSLGSAELKQLRDVQQEAARTEADLRRISMLIDHIGRFRSARGGITLLLGELAEALPESTAMVSLRVDSLEGNFVTLSTHAADVVPQLLTIERIVAPRIVGSITTEVMNTARLERAAFRFRRLRQPPSTRPRTSSTPPVSVRPRSSTFQ